MSGRNWIGCVFAVLSHSFSYFHSATYRSIYNCSDRLISRKKRLIVACFNVFINDFYRKMRDRRTIEPVMRAMYNDYSEAYFAIENLLIELNTDNAIIFFSVRMCFLRWGQDLITCSDCIFEKYFLNKRVK